MKYIASLDIGSQTIKAAVAKINGSKIIQILAIEETESDGIRKGVIVNIEEAANSIFKLIESVSQIAGVGIKDIYVGVGDTQIGMRSSHGVVIVSRADSEITEDDVKRVYGAVEGLKLPQNREILHLIPKDFVVDGDGGIKNPVGMKGLKLEINALIIEGFTPFIKNLKKAVELSNINSLGTIFSPLASARSVLIKRQKELGVVVLDIGATTSGLAVYKEGEVIYSRVIDIGSAHITNDIAIDLKVQTELAEKLKIEYGVSLPNSVSKKEIIDLETLGLAGLKISRKNIAVIINKRLTEIFKLIKKELDKLEKPLRLPGGIVITGGGSKIPLIVDLVKKEFKLPAQIGFPTGVNGIDKVDDPSYASLIGLILWGVDLKKGGSEGYLGSFDGGVSNFFKMVLKNILP